MKNVVLLIAFFLGSIGYINAQDSFPVRGFCIGSPKPAELDDFIRFIREELAPRQVNTLILRIEYNYQFESHPELRSENALSKEEIKKLVAVCREHAIRLIPQINMLGHQSWAGRVGKLLEVYPDFDETPQVKLPEKYEWPNADGLYCKSYCPLHPEVHKIVLEVIDEIGDVFETDAFHAGMDEVFYIGHNSCPRCSGRDKAELFAGEVNLLRNHLALKNRQLMIWGDRLIDGKITGIGEWEASMNNTSRAIDLIAKDVLICDWHYDRPDQTPVYFAMKGLNVVTCPWNKPEVAKTQVLDMYRFRQSATTEMKDRFQGIIQTIWTGTDAFLKEFYSTKSSNAKSQANCFRATFDAINHPEK